MQFEHESELKICHKTDLTYSSINLSKAIVRQIDLFDNIITQNNQKIEILDVLNKMLLHDNLKEASEVILRDLCKKLGFTSGVIRFFDSNVDNFLDVASIYCEDDDPNCIKEMSKPFARQLKEDLIKEVFIKNRILMIDSIREYNDSIHILQKLYALKAQSAVLIPVSYHQSPVALIFLMDSERKKDGISSYMSDNLIAVLPRISIALSLFSLNDKYKKALDIELGIRDIINQSQSLHDPDGLFDIAMRYIIDVLNADGAMRFMVRKDDSYEIKNIVHKNPLNLENIPMTGMVERVFRDVTNDKILFVNDVKADIVTENMKRFLVDNNMNSLAFYPNFYNPELFQKYEEEGFIFVYSHKSRTWLSDELYWFSLIYDTIALVYSDLKKKYILEETKNNFVISLTHDLKAPLLAEQKALEAIISNNGDGDLEHLKEIYQTNVDLVNMINNLLSIYHYENFEYSLFLEKTDIKKLLSDSISMWKYLCEEKKCKFSIDSPRELPDVFVDRREIKRVFANLISNAIKHSKDDVKIVVGIEPKEGELEISIKDTGQGIAPEDLKNIFVRYYSKKREVGNGLGLFIVKQIIEAHHGRIWVESTLGKGTTFYFTLPTAELSELG